MAKKRESGSGILGWLPLVVGILITPVALRAASVMALTGTDGLVALFPLAQVFMAPVLHLPMDVAMSTSQLSMYLEFPIYGLIMVWQRKRGLVISFGAVLLLHALGMIAAIILKHMSNPGLRFY